MRPAAEYTAADIAAAARDWVVRLQADELSTEDIIAWEAWIKCDLLHRHAYDAAAEAWALAGDALVRRPTEPELRNDRYDGAVSVATWKARRPKVWLVWSAAAAGVAAVCLTLAGWDFVAQHRIQQQGQFGTGVAQTGQIVLKDGSQVEMGAMTKIDVNFVGRKRDITLRDGEALFKVAHDRSRPFVVDTSHAQITAVGTAFDVHSTPDRVVISVTEGVVSIDSRTGQGGPFRLAAGHRMIASSRGIEIVQIDDDPRASLPWLDGRLEFRNQPLSTVLYDVNRYARTPVVLGDPAAGTFDFTGTVQVDAIEDWAKALPSVFPLNAETAAGKIVLTSKKSSAGLPKSPGSTS